MCWLRLAIDWWLNHLLVTSSVTSSVPACGSRDLPLRSTGVCSARGAGMRGWRAGVTVCVARCVSLLGVTMTRSWSCVGLMQTGTSAEGRGASFAPKPPKKQPLPNHLDPPSQHSAGAAGAPQRLKTLRAPVLSLTHLAQEGAEHRVVDTPDACAAGVHRLRCSPPGSARPPRSTPAKQQ